MPDRQALTREFWENRLRFELSVSDLVKSELTHTKDPIHRRQLLKLIDKLNLLSITTEMQDLARRYIDVGCFSQPMLSDALHVAAAVLSRQDILISWNYKHLVNRSRRAMIAAVNLDMGLPILEILSPPEL
jgi:hypothetical protein